MSNKEDHTNKPKVVESDDEKWLNKKMDRQQFLQRSTKLMIGGGLFGSFMSFACKDTSNATPSPEPPQSEKSPFQLGVASGDPLPDGVVLWTRLTTQPLAADGGMGTASLDVHWEIAKDKSFQQIVQQGTVTAVLELAHSVHVEVEGLQPFQTYYYRFKQGEHVSPTGRTKTAPATNANPDQLNFAFASCQSYTSGYYTALDHLSKEELDVVFFLGDYIYESGSKGEIGRPHIPNHSIHSLTDYRIRYGQYKSDLHLQAAHAACPWIVTVDDHEVKNNWGGDRPSDGKPEGGIFLDRRANAFKAYYEHMPLRKSSIPTFDGHIQLYRRFSYGTLAEFSVLDTRQFRTDFACGTSHSVDNCPERLDPSRSILGEQQEQWLFSGLKQSSARWNILPQQVFMAQMDRKSGPDETFSMDKWDGYVGSRKRLFDAVKENNVSNFVVLTGDIHQNFVSDLLEDFSDSNSRILGTELVTTSISSSGDGADLTSSTKRYLAENPWIKFANRQRGYVHCKLTADQLKVDYKVVPYVTKKGAPIQNRASFIVKDGKPGAIQVAGRVV